MGELNNGIVYLPVHVFHGLICLIKGGELETVMYKSFTSK